MSASPRTAVFSAYRFLELLGLTEVRAEMRTEIADRALAEDLLGTVLLAE